MNIEPDEIKITPEESQARITELTLVYRMLKEEADSFIGKLKSVKSNLLPLITEHGNYKDETGYVTLATPSERVSYDVKALDALCASSDKIKQILEPHRKVTPAGKPYLKIK